jgi:hypothetical protein
MKQMHTIITQCWVKTQNARKEDSDSYNSNCVIHTVANNLHWLKIRHDIIFFKICFHKPNGLNNMFFT